jgi:tetratricopeptide (TPR) repeat protein
MTTEQQLDVASQHHQQGRLAEAEAIYRRILATEPNNPRALQLMGVIVHQRGDSTAGAELIRRAIQLNPLSADFHSNLGVILTDCGQFDEALACYRQAIRLAPLDADYHWNLAINLLGRGDFREGWDEFEWRLHSPGRRLNRGFSQPQWNGSYLTGRTILLHTEGGFGDAIQFIRYVPLVKLRGGRIVLECQKELVRLFSQVSGIEKILARNDALPPVDYQIPLQSLPRLFETNAENVPASVPYLNASEESSRFWKDKLASEPGPRVGLVWAGSPANSLRRSTTIDVFASLADVKGVRIYSLQKGPESKQPAPAGLAIIDHTEQVNDFADLAGFIDNLDLVISVDTSVAHLAGAMGKPVWTIIGFVPDFRWMRDRTDSPWYPTMRLFRQGKAEPWTAVTARIAKALTEKFSRAPA